MTTGLFKVLTYRGKPVHGGSGKWELPTTTKPGKWMRYDGPLKICSSGYHGVTNVGPWIVARPDLVVFPLEVDLSVGADFDGTTKGCFGAVRLHPRITWDWPWLPLYPDIRLLLAVVERASNPDADLSRAKLSGGNFYQANLSRANLSGANLSGANLSRANLSGANLSRVDLSGANLSGADLSRTDLYRADLSRADLYGANLSRVELSGANLSRANLYRADLSGANLSHANLSRAYRSIDLPDGWRLDSDGRLQRITNDQ